MLTCPPVRESDSSSALESLEPLRILLAEDDVVSQQVARLMLAKLGHRVDAVSNGLEAVDAVLRGAYDVVLMDVQMPELDGLAATRRIRADLPAGRQPTIVALTANSFAEQQADCATAGMDAHIAKPLRLQALRELLASVPGRTAEECDASQGHAPSQAHASAPTPGRSRDREDAVRLRLNELSGPDPDDDQLMAALLRSFVARTPHLLDALERAVAGGAIAEVDRVAHALAGASDNLGCHELARTLRHVEALARVGDLPAAEVLRQARDEQTILRPVLNDIAGQIEARVTPPPMRASS